MKKNKKYILLIVLLFLNIGFIIYNLSENSTYIILDSDNIWQISNQKIKPVSKNKIKKYSFSEAYLYNKDKIKGYLSSNNSISFYNADMNKEKISSDSLIVVGDSKIKNYSYLLTDKIIESDLKVLGDFLKSNSLQYDIDDLYVQKAILSKNTILYSVQTRVNREYIKDDYSIIFVSTNKSNQTIYKKINSKDDRYSSVYKLIDVDNNGYADIILLSGITNNGGKQCYSLYTYNKSNEKYNKTIDCEEE